MDILASLNRRASSLNKGLSVTVVPIHVHDDGHGVYVVEARGKRSYIEQFFVNPVEAKSIGRTGKNKNIDSVLKI